MIFIYIYIYIYTGADTGFSSGGGQIGREAPEIFFVPPPELLRGGTGGDRRLEEGKINRHIKV